MVKYNCSKCIHLQVCSFKDKAIQEARTFDKTLNVPFLEYDLRCKQYRDLVTLKAEVNNYEH